MVQKCLLVTLHLVIIVIEYALNRIRCPTRSQTASLTKPKLPNGGTSIFGIQFNIDGTKMYALGNGGAGGQRYPYEYNLSTAFDPTTISIRPMNE